MNFKKCNSVWIWKNNDFESVNQFACFRQTFILSETKSEQLYISCDTNYCVWINGSFVSTGQYLAYPNNKFYDKLNITPYCRKGENLICVLVYYQGIDTSCYKKGSPGLIYTIKTSSGFISNQDTIAGTATGYIEGEHPMITGQLGPSVSYDATKSNPWITEEYIPGSDWCKAINLPYSDLFPENINKRPVKKLDLTELSLSKLIAGGTFIYNEPENVSIAKRMQTAAFSAKLVNDLSLHIEEDNTYLIFDLGKETSGYFELDMECGSDAIFDIAYGEHLDDLRVRSYVGNRNFAFSYHACKGKNKFTNYFRRIACRYIEICIRNADKPIDINYIGLRKAIYPVKEIPFTGLTDNLDKLIYKTSIYTLKQCMHEHYEDSPWREQSLYAVDSRNQALFGYAAFGNYKFAKASIQLLESSLREDGYLDICAPSEVNITIPSFSIMWIVFATEYIIYSHDSTYGKQVLKTAMKMFKIHFNNIINGLLPTPQEPKYWNFYDWATGLMGFDAKYDCDVMLQLYLALAIKHSIDLCDIVGDKTNKKTLSYKYSEIKKAINNTFFDKDKKLYRTAINHDHFCELAQALAVLSGVAENPNYLRKILSEKNNLIPFSLSSSLYKYQVLLQDKKYNDIVLDEIREIWGGMLLEGATTFFETRNGADDFEFAGSLCHGWSAVPVYVYHKIFGNYYDL